MGRPAVLKVDIVADARGVDRGVGDAEGKLGRLGSAAGKAGLAVGAGLAIGAVAVGKFAVDSIAAASRAQQAMGAVESVFGDASASVRKFADDSAMRLGLAKSEYMDLAAVVGSQLKNMGRSQAEASVESDRLISVGADLAATFGGSVTDAVGAVGSLLRGERDPIERYGIAIKDADIQARLAAEGQGKLEGAARKTAEANATLALLTEQASGAVGAFSRESDTLAGKQERLKARFEDTKAALGERLLPLVTRFADFLLTKGVPALEDFGRWIVRNKDNFIDFGATVGQILATIVEHMARWAERSFAELAVVTSGLARFVDFMFGFADTILRAADSAFGWIPGVGPKIDVARDKLGQLRDTAQEKLDATAGFFRNASDAAGRVADKAAEVRDRLGELKDRTVTIRVDYRVSGASRVTGVGGGVLVGSAAGGLYGSTPPALYGGSPDLGADSRRLATSAYSSGGFDPSTIGGPSAAFGVYVDQRRIDARVTVQAAYDPVAVARQLESLARDQANRLGRATALPYGLQPA